MKTLFKCFWSLRSPHTLLHQAKRHLISPIASHYEVINRGEKEVPKYFNFASDVLDRWTQVEKDGKRPPNGAFWWVSDQREEVKWTFEELGVLSRKAANVLLDPCSLQRGNRILVVLPKIPEWWLLNVACMRTAPDSHYCVKTTSEEPMVIYFTSGSTGPPKMVEHSQCSYGIGFTSSGRHWMDLTPSDVFWNTSDTGWVKSGWSSVFAPWIHGSCIFVHHLPQFEPAVILNTLARYPVTTFCTAPTAYRMLVQHDVTSCKFMSLKHCVTGGEPLNPEVMERWKAQTGLDIYEGYGQTETVVICSNVKGMKIKPGSLGKASPPYDVQTVDDEGNIQPPGEEGYIAIRIKPKRPFCIFSQYLDNPEKTAASERGDFYVTGDRAIKDEEGYFWFVGRSDDLINSAGYRIGPFEVESALIKHPAVIESAVVSSPDPVRGEVVKAFVVLSPAYLSHDPETLIKELQDHVKKATAPYKYPRKVEFVQELPKTVAGKIQRNVLRKREWGSV
ncbi:acyl-coenzyme A synthetase ACSM5, mitochondrial-like isoform X2 [Rhineura floridana]|uniref:acyl-coenzyme A synthetase ACSM5, mitochondrial-like isoform X2 n=1 Tax=Rhineura floridana TaxID=261503 RepID=UPI002AC88472|nr:acyl-coenzyme A synthetase ACSM5, mitochondrial-like isoform X2 [Rhineura floridana]